MMSKMVGVVKTVPGDAGRSEGREDWPQRHRDTEFGGISGRRREVGLCGTIKTGGLEQCDLAEMGRSDAAPLQG
jgi:hypothetical protein